MLLTIQFFNCIEPDSQKSVHCKFSTESRHNLIEQFICCHLFYKVLPIDILILLLCSRREIHMYLDLVGIVWISRVTHADCMCYMLHIHPLYRFKHSITLIWIRTCRSSRYILYRSPHYSRSHLTSDGWCSRILSYSILHRYLLAVDEFIMCHMMIVFDFNYDLLSSFIDWRMLSDTSIIYIGNSNFVSFKYRFICYASRKGEKQ